MPRFCVNLAMLYTEHPFLDPFAASVADGLAGRQRARHRLPGGEGQFQDGVGEAIDHSFVLEPLEAGGYDAWVGHAYRPAANTFEGLGSLAPRREH